MGESLQAEKKYNVWIVILSIAIPLAVAALFGVNLPKLGVKVQPMYFLPPIYAAINALTAIVLVVAVQAVKNGNRKLHERLVKVAIALSVAFLAMYVTYHMTTPTAIYGDLNFDGQLSESEVATAGGLRYVYYFILGTHIPLSVIIIPFVLVTYVRGIAGNYERHRKIARITYPLWLYVAVTGVIVYAMISPYYPI